MFTDGPIDLVRKNIEELKTYLNNKPVPEGVSNEEISVEEPVDYTILYAEVVKLQNQNCLQKFLHKRKRAKESKARKAHQSESQPRTIWHRLFCSCSSRVVEKQDQVDIVEDTLLKDFAEFLAAEEDFHGSRKTDQMNMLMAQLKIN